MNITSILVNTAFCALGGLVVATATQAATAADIPVEQFFKRSEFLSLTLSPDGRKIAASAPVGGRHNLVVIDLNDRKNVKVITGEVKRDVVRLRWINNRRIVFSLGDLIEQPGFQRDAGGLLAIDADGTNFRVLSATIGNQIKQGAHVIRGARFLSRLAAGADQTDDILVEANDRDARHPDVYRMNTRTGEKTLLTFDSPGNVVNWVLDQDRIVRAAVSFDDKETYSNWYRDNADAKWQKLAEFKRDQPSFYPLGFDGDNKSMLVTSDIGRDKNAIFKYDFENKRVGELVVAHDAVDVESGLIYDRIKKKYVGISIDADKPETHWFDIDWATVQKMADTTLPNTDNRLTRQEGGKLYLITSSSDTQPVFWSLLNLEAKTLEHIASSREWIKPELMSPMKPIRYKARDGLEIPAYLTLPRGSVGKNLPLIVHPHGGPWVRDHWGFNPEVQFLASRGYAVLQPNFRISTGYGNQHFKSGFKQWGLAMQDDITDAVKWAIAEGIADKDRICIYGASYGGYAALMGIIKTPELYQCAVNYVGVTNLEELFTNRFWDKSVLEYSLKARLGDPSTDQAMLKANSPVNLVDKINRPLFMAYGGLDANVLPEQGKQLGRALDRANKKYEWMFKPDEAHGYFAIENQVEFYSKMESFLRQHLGEPK